MTGTSTYQIWNGMVQRCTNPNTIAYKNYGGRGITVCNSWITFQGFFSDMGERPDGMSIERIDNDGGYSPGNCKWATKEEQATNTRSNKLITHNEITRCYSEWSRKLGGNEHLVGCLIKRGWTDIEAVSIPLGCRRKDHTD